MKFVRGGELFTHLRKARQFPEKRVKFYSMTVALALGHLHTKNIVYRDLKPENVLMDEDGYLAITDFGLAKILKEDEVTSSFCGTPEYMAPEILKEVGHTFPVDWWALGILTYELIVSFPPFYTGNSDNDKLFKKVKNSEVQFPQSKHGINMSAECKDFISKCLVKDPKERLGTKGGLDEILSHPWFADLEPQKMLDKEYTPEFIPKLSKNPLDVTQFDKMFTREEVVDTVLPAAAKKKINKVAHKFDAFTEDKQ